MSKFMTYDHWFDTYKPIKNTLTNGEDYHFETYGNEYEFIKAQDQNKVWTEVDGDEGTYIISGWHFVNRIHYYITEEPWEDDMTEVPTWMERQCDCQEALDIDLDSPVYCNECEEREGYISIPCETVADLKQIYGEDAPIVG